MSFCTLKTTSMKRTLCRNVVPCDVIEIADVFEGTTCLHLAGSLLTLLLNHEDKDSDPLRKSVNCFSLHYLTSEKTLVFVLLNFVNSVHILCTKEAYDLTLL
jgi:hypothetical protein